MNILYLIRKQFSKYFLKELLIVLQIVVLLALLSPAVTELNNLFSVMDVAKQITSPAVYFEAATYYQIPEQITEEEHIARLNEIKNSQYSTGVGLVANAGASIDNLGVSIIFYNDDLVQNTALDFDIDNTVKATESSDGVIQVIINKTLAEKYSLGDVILADNIIFPVTRTNKSSELLVVGYMDEDNYYYTLKGGGSTIRLESLGGISSVNEAIMIAVTDFDFVPKHDINPSCIIFTNSLASESVDSINTELYTLGKGATIDDMLDESINLIVLENPIIIVSTIMLLILCLTGLCSYVYLNITNSGKSYFIYYMCGMNWVKSLWLTLVSLVIILIFAFFIAMLILPYTSFRIDAQGVIYSSITIVILYVTSAIVAILRYKNTYPMDLMENKD